MADLSLVFSILAKDKASKEFNNVGDAAERAGKRGAKFGTLVGAGVATAALAVGKFAKDSVAAFKESEASSAALDEALRKFPKTADVTRKSFDELNASLAKKTVFDDDAAASGQAVLAAFNLTGKQVQQLTPLLEDYAAKTGTDLPTAAEVLGKAVLGNRKALKGVGIQFKDTGSAAGNFAELQDKLSEKVGGFAENQGKTAAGQAEILKNQFGELQETVGSKLVPKLTKLAEVGLKVVDFVSKNADVIGPLVAILGSAAAAYFLVSKAIAVTNVVLIAMGVAEEIALGPIGLIIIGIAALAAGLVYAYKNSETFRNILSGVFTVLKQALGTFVQAYVLGFKFVVDIFLGFVGVLVNGAAKAFGWVPGIGGKLKGAAEEFNKFKDKADGALQGVADAAGHFGEDTAKNFTGSFRDYLKAHPLVAKLESQVRAGGITVQTSKNAKVDFRALGGPVRAGQPYIVGEKRAELFVPNVSGRIEPKVPGGAAPITVNQVNHGVDHIEANRLLAREIRLASAGY